MAPIESVALHIGPAGFIGLFGVCHAIIRNRYKEASAPPESPAGSEFDDYEYGYSGTLFQSGYRDWAGQSAKLLFKLGLACAAAAIFALPAASEGPVSAYALFTYAILAGCLVYMVVDSCKRYGFVVDTVFDAFYEGNKYNQFYKNEPAIRSLFFSKNVVPWTAVYSSAWVYAEYNYPSADEMQVTNGGNIGIE